MTKIINNGRPIYYIGVDIGDGETALAVLAEQNGVPVLFCPQQLSPDTPFVVKVKDDKESLLSAFAKDAQGNIVIGDDALSESKYHGQTVRFKSRFLKDPMAGEDIKDFAKGLYHALEQYTTLLASEHEVRMVIGCPTGAMWSPLKRKHYAELVHTVLPIEPEPVGESRAAFLQVRYNGGANIPPALLRQTVLVIDMGSSTTDLAYVVGSREQVGVFGSEFLGGGLLDQALLEQNVDKAKRRDEILELFQRTPSVRHRCEVIMRKLKEDHYNALIQGENTDKLSFKKLYPGRSKADPIDLRLAVNDEMMDHVLNMPMKALEGKSFTGAIDELLEHAKQATAGTPPDLVIMTGGPSRMPFFREAVKAAFPHALVACSEKPESAIACGLALASRADARMQRFQEDVADYLRSHHFHDHLKNAMAVLIPMLADGLAPVYTDWRYQKNVEADLKTHGSMTKGMEERFLALPQTEKTVETVLNAWCQHCLSEIKQELTRICGVHGVAAAEVPMPKPGQLKLKLPYFPIGGLEARLKDVWMLGGLIHWLRVKKVREELLKELEKEDAPVLVMNDAPETAALNGPAAPTFRWQMVSALKESVGQEIARQAAEVQIPIVGANN